MMAILLLKVLQRAQYFGEWDNDGKYVWQRFALKWRRNCMIIIYMSSIKYGQNTVRNIDK